MTPSNQCTSLTTGGKPCRAHVEHGSLFCRWHDPSPSARAKHSAESKRGGLAKAYGALPAIAALAEDPAVAALDLETAAGLRGLLSATLGALARLPFDMRSAHAIGALATAQRSTLEISAHEARLAAVEAELAAQAEQRADGPRLVASG